MLRPKERGKGPIALLRLTLKESGANKKIAKHEQLHARRDAKVSRMEKFIEFMRQSDPRVAAHFQEEEEEEDNEQDDPLSNLVNTSLGLAIGPSSNTAAATAEATTAATAEATAAPTA